MGLWQEQVQCEIGRTIANTQILFWTTSESVPVGVSGRCLRWRRAVNKTILNNPRNGGAVYRQSIFHERSDAPVQTGGGVRYLADGKSSFWVVLKSV